MEPITPLRDDSSIDDRLLEAGEEALREINRTDNLSDLKRYSIAVGIGAAAYGALGAILGNIPIGITAGVVMGFLTESHSSQVLACYMERTKDACKRYLEMLSANPDYQERVADHPQLGENAEYIRENMALISSRLHML